MDYPTAVARLVKLNGGRLVGKTRLQKSVYLLKAHGVDLGFDFEYHHYGPYSEELNVASRDAKALGLLDIQWQNTSGNEFAIFFADASVEALESSKGKAFLRILEKYDATVLELAATADFLEKNGFAGSAWEETSRRKASKVNDSRIESSKRLLQELKRALD